MLKLIKEWWLSMKKEVLNIAKERELLSTSCKRLLDDTMRDIEIVAKEMNLTKEEKEALRQRTAAAIICGALSEENNYLSRTNDELGKRKIERNKLKMASLNHIYQDNYPEVKGIEQEANKKLMERKAEREKAQANQNKQTKKAAPSRTPGKKAA